jgi:hypothetical protein
LQIIERGWKPLGELVQHARSKSVAIIEPKTSRRLSAP